MLSLLDYPDESLFLKPLKIDPTLGRQACGNNHSMRTTTGKPCRYGKKKTLQLWVNVLLFLFSQVIWGSSLSQIIICETWWCLCLRVTSGEQSSSTTIQLAEVKRCGFLKTVITTCCDRGNSCCQFIM